ncbi:STM4014 family protein [Sphaerisporangium sp. NPDC049002]|uniref:STM4014 family protein n=1 Tax=Sphaerisporangium sp. NPDC049002 TaxID=3155392 RepID=UPI0033C1C0CD
MTVAFTVVGTPGDRRVTMFGEAARGRGLPDPAVLPWTSVLSGDEVRLEPGTLVRVDSPGEDPEADALLRGPGDPARAGGGAAWYATFLWALDRVRRAVARAPGAVVLGDLGEIAVMFDKRSCHARLSAVGVPVPPALPGPVRSYGELRDRMEAAGWARVFVKPAHGSSASGVVALHAAGGRVRATTSAVPDPMGVPAGARSALRNSLRVRTYEGDSDVAAIIDALAPDGLHVERWFPKASAGGRVIDLRVVVVAGVPTHVVVRASRTPMTNLHLGGVRGDLGVVREALGPRRWDRAMEVCAQAAACFPGSLAVGVDLLLGVGWKRFAVAEVNAFGDLLPGLTGLPGSGAEGLSTYEAEVEAVLTGSALAMGPASSGRDRSRAEGAPACAT